MISLEQYLAAIACFTNCHVNIRATCTRNTVPHNISSFVGKCCLHTVLLNYFSKLLLLGGDIETNPGPPTKKCPHCSSLIHIRKKICDNCGYHKGSTTTKKCPQCASFVNVRKMSCKCGYSFNSKNTSRTCCKVQSKHCMATLRANEPQSAAMQRKQFNRQQMASARASQPEDVVEQRRQQNRQQMANARAIETPEASQNRKTQNAVSMRARRNRTLTIDETISAFLSKIRVGPEYVCAVCHRMMYYYSNVVPFMREKYTKGSPEMLQSVFSVMYVCPDGSQWMCHSCDRTIKRGTLPVQAKANGFQLDPIPPELDGLNELEIRLISLRIPFMKMVAYHLVDNKVSMVQLLMCPLMLIMYVKCFPVCHHKVS